MTSFQKKARIKVGQIQGTRPSLYNNQLLISTGIPSLDNVIGGGLAVGTVLLIEEDVYGSYARLMLKYFLAEAVLTEQAVFLSSKDEMPQHLIQELPLPIENIISSAKKSDAAVTPQPGSRWSQPASSTTSESDHTETGAGKETEAKMKIAWRYQSKPKIQNVTSSQHTQFGHYYDLTKTMDSSILETAQIFFASNVDVAGESQARPSVKGMNCNYVHLLHDIKKRIQEGGFGTFEDVKERKILRIGLHCLGSPLWGENGGFKQDDQSIDPSLTLFLIALRAVLRSSFGVAVITVPTHLFHNKAYIHRMERLCDTVLRLESFAGSEKEKNPVFKEYHGLLHLRQLPRLNSLVPVQPLISDLAFKLRRKKFTIEKLHLPPEFADTRERAEEDESLFSILQKGSGCASSSQSSKLSF